MDVRQYLADMLMSLHTENEVTVTVIDNGVRVIVKDDDEEK